MAVEAGGGDDWFFDIRPGDPEGLDKSPVVRVQLTGNYVSQNTGTDRNRFLSRYTGGKVSLVQSGNGITGTYGDSGKIFGTIKGRNISFEWWGIPREGNGVGQWVVNSDGSELTGTWVSSGRHYSGTWNLTRID